MISAAVSIGDSVVMEETLRVTSLYKEFPGVKVLKGISFNLKAGKIYALVGENGAGKSTLVKILMGIHSPGSGEIFIKNETVKIKDPIHARNAYKIDAVFQEHSLIPQLSIAENISLVDLKSHYSHSLLSNTKLNTRAEEVLEEVGLSLDVSKPAEKLNEGEKSLIELAKVIARNPDIILFDEMTASLESSIVEELFTIIRDLKSKGKTIIFISHRLDEVLKISDEILVLKDGDLVGTLDNEVKEDFPEKRKKIINYMTGIAGGLQFPPKTGLKTQGKVVLSIQGLASKHLKPTNLEVREGEIVGLAGLRGQGQSKLLRTIAGILNKQEGQIFIDGQEVKINSISDAMKAGIYYLSDRRDDEELWPSHDVLFNMALSSIDQRSIGGIIRKRVEHAHARRMVEKLRIKTPNLENIIRCLSGGNRQKVVLSKYLLAKPKVLLLDQPTVGVDIGAKMEIYQLLRALADEGIPTLALLTDREEILQLPDRLLVMCEGEIVNECCEADVDEKRLLDSYYK